MMFTDHDLPQHNAPTSHGVAPVARTNAATTADSR